MKELDALMNALNEKGIPESLKKTTESVPFPKEADTPEKKQELVDKAIRFCLAFHFAHNDELNDLFAEFSFMVGMEALIEKLAIKAPEEPSESDIEKLFAGLDNFLKALKNL